MEVGILIPTAGIKIEYWMWVTLEPVPDDHDPSIYLRALKDEWVMRLRGISEGLTESIEECLGNNFDCRVRYVFNNPRIWFVPIPMITKDL
jgi:hypothetical protein